MMKKGQRIRNTGGRTGRVRYHWPSLQIVSVQWDSGWLSFVDEDQVCLIPPGIADARINEALGTIEDVAWLTGPRGFSRI